MDKVFGPYLDPLEASQADAASTDRALGAVIAMLAELYMEKRNIGFQLSDLDPDEDEDEVYELSLR